MNKRTVLVFKNRLGEYSETFIYKQASALRTFNVKYLCSRCLENGLANYSGSISIVCKTKLEYVFELLLSFKISATRYIKVIRNYSRNPS